MGTDYSKYEAALAGDSSYEEPQKTEVTTKRAHTVANVERHNPPEDILEAEKAYKSTPLLLKGINKFAHDVVAPGWRIEADNDTTQEELETWLENAAIIGGEKKKDVQLLAEQFVITFQVKGTVVTEHVKAAEDETDITGMRHIPVESLYPQTYPNKAILLEPDEEGIDHAIKTKRDETAAYVQWHSSSLLGQRGAIPDSRNSVALSLNDVTKTANNPSESDIWGNSPIVSVLPRIHGLKQKLADNEEAVKSKAYGIWSVSFGRDVMDVNGTPDIKEWDDDSQDEFMDSLGDMGAGELIGHDGTVEFDRHDGEVADILDYLLFDIDYILSAVPVPKYAVGFGEQITQHVTQRQEENYDSQIKEMRGILERHMNEMIRKYARQNGLQGADDVQFKIEPKEDDSPIMSLETEEIERINSYTESLGNASPSGDPLDIINEESLRSLVLQLPDDAEPDDEEPISQDIIQQVDDYSALPGGSEPANPQSTPQPPGEEAEDAPPQVEADD